jgi:hypothetical protein
LRGAAKMVRAIADACICDEVIRLFFVGRAVPPDEPVTARPRAE